MQIIKEDSELLRLNRLMDYSIFLIIIDNTKTMIDIEENTHVEEKDCLVFNPSSKSYVFQKMSDCIMSQVDSMHLSLVQNEIKKKFKSEISKRMLTKTKNSDNLLMKEERGYADIVSNDGKFRYKIAIIDFLTYYTGLKFIENRFKATVAGVDNQEISSIDHDTYKTRFD